MNNQLGEQVADIFLKLRPALPHEGPPGPVVLSQAFLQGLSQQPAISTQPIPRTPDDIASPNEVYQVNEAPAPSPPAAPSNDFTPGFGWPSMAERRVRPVTVNPITRRGL